MTFLPVMAGSYLRFVPQFDIFRKALKGQQEEYSTDLALSFNTGVVDSLESLI